MICCLIEHDGHLRLLAGRAVSFRRLFSSFILLVGGVNVSWDRSGNGEDMGRIICHDHMKPRRVKEMRRRLARRSEDKRRASDKDSR